MIIERHQGSGCESCQCSGFGHITLFLGDIDEIPKTSFSLKCFRNNLQINNITQKSTPTVANVVIVSITNAA